jgi:uncharacterized protein DUF11
MFGRRKIMVLFSIKKFCVLAILVVAVLLPAGIASAQSGNCDGILNTNHSSDWNNWDSLIERLRSRGCAYADVGVTIFASGNPIHFQFPDFTYTIIIDSTGTTAANDFEVTVAMPAEVDWPNFDVDVGGVSGLACGRTLGNNLDCTVGSLPAGSHMSITIYATALFVRTFTATATLTKLPSNGDLDPRNNSASATVTVTLN